MDNIAISEWIAFADMDYNSAKFLCGMHPRPLEIICYHSQQSAEKMLKAYLVYQNIIPQKTHDLELLRCKCEEFDSSFQEIFDECNRLNPYSVQPRYPFGLELTDEIMDLAIKDCLNVASFVKLRIV